MNLDELSGDGQPQPCPAGGPRPRPVGPVETLKYVWQVFNRYAAPGVPHTRTGKKLEIPVKRLMQGADADRVVDRSAVDAPELIDWYAARRP